MRKKRGRDPKVPNDGIGIVVYKHNERTDVTPIGDKWHGKGPSPLKGCTQSTGTGSVSLSFTPCITWASFKLKAGPQPGRRTWRGLGLRRVVFAQINELATKAQPRLRTRLARSSLLLKASVYVRSAFSDSLFFFFFFDKKWKKKNFRVLFPFSLQNKKTYFWVFRRNYLYKLKHVCRCLTLGSFIFF